MTFIINSFGEIDLRTAQPPGGSAEDVPSIGDGSPESTVSGPVSAHFGTPPGRSPVAWARVLPPEIDLKWFGGAYALFPTLRRGPQSASPEILVIIRPDYLCGTLHEFPDVLIPDAKSSDGGISGRTSSGHDPGMVAGALVKQ